MNFIVGRAYKCLHPLKELLKQFDGDHTRAVEYLTKTFSYVKYVYDAEINGKKVL